MNTSDKILDAARNLFNENGIRNTTTRHIASSMSISPGNLHYHFKHTEDIVIALFRQLTDWYDGIVDEVQELPMERLEDLTSTLELVYEQVDKFRFLFIHFVEISIWIPEIKNDYAKLIAKREGQFKTWLRNLQDQGVLLPLDDLEEEQLVKKLFIVGDFWISHNALFKQYTGEEAKRDFVSTMLSILSPHCKKSR
ncbi:transcriptional regulator, TetR family [Sphingobacterium nematocida]|uniref:Transcriptional regulator, TetR family n=1 Tax=Sphingobacterium nematocida TaxID=1513896 RepID=A0A1T5B195_9SPHI|nr:TetR/AcrR family transcriptional regulator [Sphingobacterium nematocida]SKB40984.1 transcriptional regulator, TetR family [Sphingobacterium nematocida]